MMSINVVSFHHVCQTASGRLNNFTKIYAVNFIMLATEENFIRETDRISS